MTMTALPAAAPAAQTPTVPGPTTGHDFEIRPWGEWHVLDEGTGFKVKRIEVNPGQRLSYQTHEHRAETWVVAAGTCTAVVDGEVVVAAVGESVYVEIGQPHRITNQHDEMLVIIEVQHGAYTGEDDICRLEDDYGRVAPRD